MPASALPLELIQRLGWSGRVQAAVQIPPGFSGGRVFHVRVKGHGEFAAKRLPLGTDAQRVSRVHLALDEIRCEGVASLPAFQQLHQVSGELWEVANWQPGRPLCLDANVDKIAAGARAIGSFHRVSMKLNRHSPPQTPKSIHDRIQRLASIQLNLPSPDVVAERYLELHCVTDAGERSEFRQAVFDAMTTLRQGWPIVGDELCQRLAFQATKPTHCCFVMRDIHREHALFDDEQFDDEQFDGDLPDGDQPDGEQFDGDLSDGDLSDGEKASQVRFIDFDAARVDTPAIDLARWIGSFATADRNDMDAILTESLAAYQKENPSLVSKQHHWIDLIGLLQHSGAWGALANWVEWVNEGRRFDAGIVEVTKRIQLIRDAAGVLLS